MQGVFLDFHAVVESLSLHWGFDYRLKTENELYHNDPIINIKLFFREAVPLM